MNRVALTFIGKDQPGIIAEVCRILFKAGCNIEDTTMTLLENEFAMILIADIPSARQEAQLKNSFGLLKKKWGLDCFSKKVTSHVKRGDKHLPGATTCVVSVAGKDRTGIVYETSRVLAQHGLNITDLNSKILGKKGKEIFMMFLEVDIPKHFNPKRLDSAWRNIEKRLGVEIKIRPLESLTL